MFLTGDLNIRLYLNMGISDLFGWLSSAFFTPSKLPALHILLSDLSSQVVPLKSANTLPMSRATFRFPIEAVFGGVNFISFSPTMRDCCFTTNCQSLWQAILYRTSASSKFLVMTSNFTLTCQYSLPILLFVHV